MSNESKDRIPEASSESVKVEPTWVCLGQYPEPKCAIERSLADFRIAPFAGENSKDAVPVYRDEIYICGLMKVSGWKYDFKRVLRRFVCVYEDSVRAPVVFYAPSERSLVAWLFFHYRDPVNKCHVVELTPAHLYERK